MPSLLPVNSWGGVRGLVDAEAVEPFAASPLMEQGEAGVCVILEFKPLCPKTLKP